MASSDKEIILFHYSFSPYARRVTWYLALRGIPYVEVKQPPVMPRPDLEAIGVNYRRIPVMAIGKDVYCDTRLMISKLEQFYPAGALGASDPYQKALQKLLEVWMVEGGIFHRASQLIPSDMPLLNDSKFTKDREQFSGRPWSKDKIEEARPEALAHIRNAFKFLETTLLADGRDWILKTDKPSLADIEAIWAFDWLNGLKGALPRDLISEQFYPAVFAWMKRFNEALKATKAKGPKAAVVKGNDAAQRILNADFMESETKVDRSDPLGLHSGTQVEVHPIDSGFSHKDRGSLVSLTENEVAIELQNGLRLHFPRTGFRIKKVDTAQSKL